MEWFELKNDDYKKKNLYTLGLKQNMHILPVIFISRLSPRQWNLYFFFLPGRGD